MDAEAERRVFAPDAAEVAAVRTFVAQAASHCGGDVETAVLVASELATNAVLHARSAFAVAVWGDDAGLVIEVADENPRLPAPVDPGGRNLSGRGLQLVGALSAAWGVRPNADGKAVWARF